MTPNDIRLTVCYTKLIFHATVVTVRRARKEADGEATMTGAKAAASDIAASAALRRYQVGSPATDL